jgi:hypothetical protein
MGALPPGRYALAVTTTGQYLQMEGTTGLITSFVGLIVRYSGWYLDVYNTVTTGKGKGDSDNQVALYDLSTFSV